MGTPQSGASEVAGQALIDRRRGEQVNFDTRSAHPLDALAGGARVGVLAANHDAGRGSLDNKVGAGRTARRSVRARFERCINGCPASKARRLFKCRSLGVWAATLMCPATSNDASIPDDHASDCWVGVGERASARGQPCG